MELQNKAIKPHAIFLPLPLQGHINPMLKLAKVLHSKGFHITFVNTEFSQQHFIGADSVEGLHGFQFKTIPDGLSPSEPRAIPKVCTSLDQNGFVPFINFVKTLNDSSDTPNVTCIISDGVLAFTLKGAEELGIPGFLFYSYSACGHMCFLHFEELQARGYLPFKDKNSFANDYLETKIDFIPGIESIQLKDFPTFIRTTDPNDTLVNHMIIQSNKALNAKGIILNTYNELEKEVVEALRHKFNQVYTIGPLQLLERQVSNGEVKSITLNFFKEDIKCIEWLDRKAKNSVLFVNFGSLTVMSKEYLHEFAWGLANSNQHFLWIIRPDLVSGDSSILPEEFLEETKGRRMLAGWSAQEKILAHPSIGGFLTHSGWNSTIESITEGIPMICWPNFSEQYTNCMYACTKWNIGMEIESKVRREEVEELVRDLMVGEKGKEMRKKALEWKEKACLATKPGGSSYQNLEKLISDINFLEDYI